MKQVSEYHLIGMRDVWFSMLYAVCMLSLPKAGSVQGDPSGSHHMSFQIL